MSNMERINELEQNRLTNQIERIEELTRARISQGEECERRHNFLCRLKEVIDEYFEQDLKGGKMI